MFTRFNDLPSEIRGLIWEATLPPRRIFHVRGSITIYPEQGWPSLKRFIFHIQHRHPVATQVCRESRAAALRRGFFFPKCPDVWFNPDRDMLYIDRNQRRLIQSQGGDAVYRVDGLERVKHLGIEWRAWFRDIPALQSEESMRERWKYALRSVNLYMPNLESINFVLPQTRYCGGMSFGREPYGAWEHPCELITLPANINVPWGKTLPPGAPLTDPALAVSFGRQLTTRLTTWETIRGQMIDALEDDDEAAKEEEGEEIDELGHVMPRPGGQIPQVVGWWLLRVGDGTSYNNQEVRTFTS
ncbi:hypothetical protein VFPPC_09303 [Pochonia chlamydosporia 170]|uniref:2EXR domain-containing protein n=1 Tax=Pochonia chlamydosporia 170 TaxID=1380566 RepID=A0A179F807_METCM|nr:hypothetical protein VFPPC_09303 [Pochonia chlamydosporia 170]OAQ61470.1 hypothetical protein VFPPC_09303 [Pochonia chlamydosporia 170]